MSTNPENKTPGRLGFRMPAEWEKHEATWLGWPHELTDWPGKFAPIPWAFAEIVRHLSQVERVNLLVENAASGNRVRVILEGGSIDVNGLGTLLTTEECLLSKTQERNPGFTREDYAAVFREYLGVTNVLWLKNGIAGDDTHGHVDDLTRFVNPTTVVTIVESDKSDANYAALQENLALLKTMKDQDGAPLQVVT